MSGPSLARRHIPEGIRPTKVGVGFVLLALVVGIAGTNTGNNALYMVLSVMLGTLIVSGVLSRNNVRAVEIEVVPPEEMFADTPADFRVRLENHSRYTSRWLLAVSLGEDPASTLFPYLAPQDSKSTILELLPAKRGVYKLGSAHLVTLFPLGFFRKGMRQTLGRELLVYPQLQPVDADAIESGAALGSRPSRRSGWGHEPHMLRGFRHGDDPRRIHWKQSARTGKLIVMEREAEENRRLSVLLDNCVDPAAGAEGEEQLEARISEAASTAVEFLRRGYEVELVTHSTRLPFGSGQRQRRFVLEALALLEAVPAGAGPLGGHGDFEVRCE